MVRNYWKKEGFLVKRYGYELLKNDTFYKLPGRPERILVKENKIVFFDEKEKLFEVTLDDLDIIKKAYSGGNYGRQKK